MSVILVLRALGLGDLLTGVPALHGLRAAYPDAEIVLAAPEPLAPLAALTGAVDALLPTGGLGGLAWNRPPPEVAVNLHGSGPESIADLVAVRPGALLTHRHPACPAVPGPEWRADVHEVDRWCGLLRAYGIPADPGDLSVERPAARPAAARAVVIHPGAASAARRWPAERFGHVAGALAAEGYRVAVTAGPGERGLAGAVAAAGGLPPDAVVAGDLPGLAALVADAQLVLCGDTGVGHLATAFGTPSVLLFGPTPPRLWGPPDDPRHTVLWVGDVGDPHADEPDRGLLLLDADRVLGAARAALARPRRTHRPVARVRVGG